MKKINTYYHSIIWANLLTVVVGCSYGPRNYMMGHPSSAQQGILGQPLSCKLDLAREKINGLVEAFKECALFIYKHTDSYSSNNIFRIHNEFCLKQRKDNQQQHDLMPYDAISSMDWTRISKYKMEKSQNGQASSSTLQMLFSLKLWKEEASEHLKDLLNDQLMKEHPDQFIKTVVKDKIKANNYTDKNTWKQYRRLCKQKQQNDNRSNASHASVGPFCDAVFSYLYEDLLPYWGKVVELFLFHALNTSVAQGKIPFKEAKKKYQTACKTIESICSAAHIKDLISCFEIETRKVIDHMEYKNRYSPIELIEKLEKYTLHPIQKMYTKLSGLIDEIEYSDDTNLKEKVMGSLTRFYSIVYGFGITDLMSVFGSLVSIYSIPCRQQLKKLLKEIGMADVQLLRTQIYLADFIEGNHNCDEINNKVSELANHVNNLLKRA